MWPVQKMDSHDDSVGVADASRVQNIEARLSKLVSVHIFFSHRFCRDHVPECLPPGMRDGTYLPKRVLVIFFIKSIVDGFLIFLSKVAAGANAGKERCEMFVFSSPLLCTRSWPASHSIFPKSINFQSFECSFLPLSINCPSPSAQ